MANEFKIKHGFISTGSGSVEGELRITGASYADNGSRIATRPWVTQFLSDNSYATSGDITTAISNLVDSAPGTLDTLNELAAAIGDDPDFATSISTSIASKLPLAGGTMTGNITFTDNAEGIVWSRNTDGASIKFYNTADGDTDSRLEFHTNDNNNEYFRWTHGPSGGALYEVMKLMPTEAGGSRLTVQGEVFEGSERVATQTHVSSNYLSKFHDMTITLTGDASGTGTFNNMGDVSFAVTVANDSHTHDGRYYTETEVDTALGTKAAKVHTHDAADITSGTFPSERLSGTYTINISGTSTYANNLYRDDNRTIAPSEDTNGTLSFGFTSFQNDNSGPWADYLHLRSYTDSSGGRDNLLMFSKSDMEIRLWQQDFNSADNYAEFRDVAFKDELQTPAIKSNGSTPSLSSGISAGEIRTLIGAGTSSFDGAYSSLSGLPSLGTAAASNIGDFATAAQGTKADTAHGWGNHADANYLTSVPSEYLTQTEGDARYLELSGGRLTGDLLVGSTDKTSDTVVKSLADQSYKAGFEAYGNGQGTGYFYAGQSSSYGGGFSYNGDGSPGFISGETADHITFFRREADNNYEVFHYAYSGSDVYFNGEVHSGGGNSSQWNTAVSWGNHADANYLTAVPATFSATQITLGSGVVLSESSDRSDLLSISSSTSSWGGLQVTNSSNEALGSFMVNDTTIGLYDDQQGEWIMQYTENAGIQFFNNGSAKLTTNGSGANVVGRLYATDGIHVDYSEGGHEPMIVLNGATNYGLFHTEATNDKFTFDFNGDQKFQFSQDGIFTINGNTITTGKVTNWDTAFGWGDHASAGYITSADGGNAGTLDGIDSTGFVKQLSDTDNPNYFTPSSRRVDPNATNPTNAHYAITTFGNGGNVTGQLATHFQTGKLYSRGHNTSWSAWNAYATESYVNTAISNLVDSSPAALNTLNELAAALGDDANFSTTVANNIGAIDERINTEVLPLIPTDNNQLTNGAGYITDGNTNWNNSYGFITASDSITGTSGGVNKVVGAGNESDLLYSTIASNDFFRLRVGGASNAGFVEIATADDGTEPIYVRQYTGVFSTLQRTAALLDGSGNTSFPGNLSSNNIITNQVFMQSITSDGTIANDKGSYLHIGGWGVSRTHSSAVLVNTAYMADRLAYNRTFTIGSTGKNFNGSGNVSWTLAEIGAEAAGAAAAVDLRIEEEVLPAIPTNNNQLTNGAGYITSADGGNAQTLDGLDSSVFMRKSANSVLDMNNFNIQEVNHITFNDSGFGEGLQWQNWMISDAPDNLSNAAGNFQISSTEDPNIRVTVDTNGNLYPSRDRSHLLGLDTNRWQIVFCEILDSAGQHEKNLQNPEGEKSVGEYPTGTVLVWKGGKNIPCTDYADHMRMGVAVEGVASPLIQGAEPVLVTGPVNEGDYIITSRKEGHAEAISPEAMRKQGLYDCVFGKALETADGESHLVKVWINI
jgi:hypothetical protein